MNKQMQCWLRGGKEMIKEWLMLMGGVFMFTMIILFFGVITTIIINYFLGNVGVC